MQLSEQSYPTVGAGIIVLLQMHQALCEAASVSSATALPKKVLSNSLNAELIYVFRCELDIVRVECVRRNIEVSLRRI